MHNLSYLSNRFSQVQSYLLRDLKRMLLYALIIVSQRTIYEKGKFYLTVTVSEIVSGRTAIQTELRVTLTALFSAVN